MASPMSYERQVEDAGVIEFDNHEQFGKHDERYVAHTSTLAIKITETPKDGNVRYTLLLLPMDLESPLEDDDDDCVLFGNSDFNLLKGKNPVNGYLASSMSFQLADDADNNFKMGGVIFPTTTMTFTVQIAMEGTKERIGGFQKSEDESVEAKLAKRAAALKAIKDTMIG